MEEILEFVMNITVPFFKLKNQGLDNVIRESLNSKQYNTHEFEVLKIISYKILEAPVEDTGINFKLKVKIVCNFPKVGKICELNGFEIIGNNVLYSSSRIQIIADKPHVFFPENFYKVKIEKVSLFSRNILCVGTILG